MQKNKYLIKKPKQNHPKKQEKRVNNQKNDEKRFTIEIN